MFPRNLTRICNRLAVIASSHITLSACCESLGSVSVRNVSLMTGIRPPVVTTGSSRSLQFPRQLSSAVNSDEQESTADCEDELMEDLEQDVVESGSRQFHLKDLLYSGTEDEIILRLNECAGPDELFKLYKDCGDRFNEQHATQFTILLWSFMRSNEKGSTTRATIPALEFGAFLNQLQPLIHKMNFDEMTCSLLYLQKIGVDSSHKTMQELLCFTANSIKEGTSNIPLSALSRFAVAVNTNGDIFTPLVSKEIVPHIIEHLRACSEVDEMRLLTICLQHLNQLVTKDIFTLYKQKLEELLKNGKITKDDVRCILKFINFLNIPCWSQENTALVSSLLLLLKDTFSDMSAKELEIVFRVLQSQLEPASLIPDLKEASGRLFERCPTIETLDFVIRFLQPKKRHKMIATVEKIISNESLTSAQLPRAFRILRSLKISNIKLCNKYWRLVLDEIQKSPNEKEFHRLSRHSHRYMYFNNNLGGTYHNREFEHAVCELMLEDIEHGLSGIVPSRFAKSASFIIAYGGNISSSEEIPAVIMDKMATMSKQFSIFDCLQLSRGLQIAFEMRFRHSISAEVAPKLNQISNILIECAERHLQEDLNLQDLNHVVRSFINSRVPRKTYLFQNLMDRYRGSIKFLNSRIIRDLTFNLSATNYVIPEICESILQYVYDNRNHVTGDTVEKVLTCCYSIGYMPQNLEVLHWCDEIIKRDFKFMNSLSIVQSCLALCYFKSLSEQLIHQVFTIDFIQQVEDEIKMCYSKETYPERILNQVMQLNRAVCLDYPEAQVPWFQQNYIEAQLSKQANIQSKFYTDIRRLLTFVVDDERLLKCNHVTPYGYRIDFVVHLNRSNKFISPPKDSRVIDKISKVAILLQKLDSFCENKLTAMKGSELLKLRHLEILGYKVVHINFNDWNSMYMNMPGAKVEYLKNLLQIQ